jgi:hypothetical protein
MTDKKVEPKRKLKGKGNVGTEMGITRSGYHATVEHK